MTPRTLRRAIVTVALVALAALAVALRAPLERAALAGIIDGVSGDRIAFDGVQVGVRTAVLQGVRLEAGGAPLLRARRVALSYDLRDLFPGGRRRYGLISLGLWRPQLTLSRRADGTLVGISPRTAPALRPAGASSGAPLNLSVTVHDGSVTLLDPNRRIASARRLELGAMNGYATLNERGRTVYRIGADLAADGSEHLTLTGMSDAARRYAIAQLSAPRVVLPAAVNYFINAPQAELERGIASDVVVRAYGFADARGEFTYHLAGSARVSGAALRVPGMIAALHDLHGRLDLSDGGLSAPQVRAILGSVPVRVAGGLYDWAAPALRLGVRVPHADVRSVARLFAFSRRLPVTGSGGASALIEGPVGAPTIFVQIGAPRVRYGKFPLASLGGAIAYDHAAIDILDASAMYAGLKVESRGVVALGNGAPNTQLAVRAVGSAAQVPYLAELAPGLRVAGDGELRGDGLRLDASGAVIGSGGGTQLAGVFHVDPAGDGTLGPLTLRRDDGATLIGAFNLHRSTSDSGFWAQAHDYPYAALPEVPRLAGLTLLAPHFSSRLDGQAAGAGRPSNFRLAGTMRADALHIGGVAIDSATGDFAGAFEALRLKDVRARGAWGAFAGDGVYAGGRLALQGDYHGSFGQLRVFTGDVRARGPVAGPVALEVDPGRTIVQLRGATTPGATLAGLHVEGLQGTVSVAAGRLHVYGATARLGGGQAAAAGGFERRIGLSLADVAAAGAVELADVDPGRVSAIGTVGLIDGRPRFDGAAIVQAARVRGNEAEANGALQFSAQRLQLSDVRARVGTTVGTLRGRIDAPGTPALAFDLGIQVPAAPLEPLLRDAGEDALDVTGTVNARVAVRGTPRRYSVVGAIGVGEGSLHGLAFRDLRADIAAGPGGIVARNGTVTVGSTGVRFAGSTQAGRSAARLMLPAANLADFNDYFDAGDTLAGTGRIALAFARRDDAVTTAADVRLRGLRYARFELGNADAHWTSIGRNVVGSLAFGGRTGIVAATGALRLPPGVAPSELVRQSAFRGSARVRGLDLGVWLPTLGYALPVGGRVDADAVISGKLDNPNVRTTATLRDGSLGTVPVDRLDVEAISTLRRTTLERAELSLPSVEVLASGSFGTGLRAPVKLAVHAKSPNLAVLGTRFFGAARGVTGAAEADIRIDGTRGNPRIAGGFDVESARVRGVAIPRALGQFSLHGRDVVLSSVEVNFDKGALELAGSLPFEIAPLGFGPPRAPVALQGEVRAIDLTDFAPLLPPGSTLEGELAGSVAIEGTAGAPRLAGAVSLRDGSVRTPAETVPLEGITAELSLAGRTATLQRLRAQAGGGSVEASGSAAFADFEDGGASATYALSVVADTLHLNSPAYGGGQLDGHVILVRPAGAAAMLRGNIAVSDATIPFSALLVAGGGGSPARGSLPALGLDFGVDAGRDVRVRSANVDIGARGKLHVTGSLAAPQLAGAFTSTGGTLTYFNTVFRLQDGTVRFAPDNGVIPTLDAVATTHVIDPDPNTVRNSAGTADVTLNVSGPVNNLSIELGSEPAYDREQILGLLLGAPALGASDLFGETAGSPTLYGSNTTAGLRPAVVGNRNANGELNVTQEAFGIANAQFTRTLLAPFETSFAQAVGLNAFNLNVDYTGNVGVQARKQVGRKLNALLGTSFGYPYRQTFGFEYRPNPFSAAQLTAFQTLGASGLSSLTPTVSITNTSKVEAAQPQSGTAGVSFSLQRLFP